MIKKWCSFISHNRDVEIRVQAPTRIRDELKKRARERGRTIANECIVRLAVSLDLEDNASAKKKGSNDE